MTAILDNGLSICHTVFDWLKIVDGIMLDAGFRTVTLNYVKDIFSRKAVIFRY